MTTENSSLAPTNNVPPVPAVEAPKKPKSAALAVQAWMDQPRMKDALSNALSGYMTVETFAAQCYIAAQNPDLAACSAESLFKAFLECAQMGLLPGTHYRHVAMVPRKGVITVSPQWQGYKFLMERQDGIKSVMPVLVHTSDEFDVIEADNTTKVVHRFKPLAKGRTFKHPDDAKDGATGLEGGYLKVEHTDGTIRYHFVTADKIDRNRRCAETQAIWRKWFEEMCMKTVIRDAWAKRVVSIDPALAARVGHADEAENLALGNDPARVAKMLASGGADDVPDMSRLPTGREALGLGGGDRVPDAVQAVVATPVATPAAD